MNPQVGSPDRPSIKSQRVALALVVLALATGLGFTVAGFFWLQDLVHKEDRARFEQRVDRMQADVQGLLNAPLPSLRGAAGVYAMSKTVGRADFRAYVESVQPTRDLPGVRGLGFVVRVPRAELERVVAHEQADGAPGFVVHGGGRFALSSRPDLYVVKFVEPQADNHAVLGLDAGSEAVRREAVERAIATGEPTLSRTVTLVQDDGDGWVYLLPVFRTGTDASTPAQRSAALTGLLFASIAAGEMFEAVVAGTQGQLVFALFDGIGTAGPPVFAVDGLLASAPGRPGPARQAAGQFQASRRIVAGGRTLTLHASSSAGFGAEAARPLPVLLAVGGVLLSLLLALTTWLLGSSRSRALAGGQRLTRNLAHEQKRLRDIVEGANVGTWEWNVQTGEARFDERWAGITGHTLGELLPGSIQTWSKLSHPEDLARARTLLEQHFAGQTPYFDHEARMRHKEGRWVWVLSRGRVSVWTDQQRPGLMAGTLMDITERQAGQTALRNSEAHFRQLFEASLDSMLQTRPDGLVLHANPAACQLFGLGLEDLRRRNWHGLVDPGDTRLRALLEEGQREGQARGELKMLRPDGSHFDCELSSSMFLDPNNEARVNVVLRDITARKRSEARITGLNTELERRVQRRTAQLEASNRDLQEFAYSVAHDLRQPFIAIGGFSGLLERSVDDERGRHYLQRIKAGVKQAGELTEALLALANLSRVQLRPQEVNLSAIAHSVMDSLRQQDSTRVVSVSIQGGLLVQADPILLRLVMEELLGNAWKFTSRQSRTEISFGVQPAAAPAAGEGAPAETVYVVRDNGEGFDMAHADKLFRSFQRLHSPLDFPGAGVGLANIQRIIARHGGQIWAQSATGQGASFCFTLRSARS